MTLPNFVQTSNNNEADSLFDPAGTPWLKAGGRTIPGDGGLDSQDTKPHLVEDATALLGHGSKAVAAGPTRTKLATTSTPALRITVKAWVTNTHTLYVGLSAVTADNTSTGGFQLSPGESLTCGIDDVEDVYIHGTAAEGASFFYEE